MADKTPMMNLISPSWFKDVSKSSIWIVGYRMMQVAQKDFTQSKPTIDLGDVRAIFNYGILSYMDASNIFEFGTDHVRNANYSKFEPKETNIGGWTIYYNGPRNLNTEEGRHKIYSKHDEKTVYSSFQGQSRPGTSQGREDHDTNRRRIGSSPDSIEGVASTCYRRVARPL
jgi:hypothetical protein